MNFWTIVIITELMWPPSDVQKLVGTSGYQAPEFLRSAGAAVSAKCDVYSFGVTVWSAAAMSAPFENVHPHTVIFKVGGNERATWNKASAGQGMPSAFKS